MFSIRRMLALGVGAGIMYYLDPKSGKERRNSLFHRMRPYMDQAQETAQSQVQDLRGQAEDLVAQGKAQAREQAERVREQAGDLGSKVSGVMGRTSDEHPSSGESLRQEAFPQDEQLKDRVQSHLSSRPDVSRDINVSAHDGRVYLTGTVEVDRLQEVLSAAREVDGVREVVNQLHLVAH